MFRCCRRGVFKTPLKYFCLLGLYNHGAFVHSNCPRDSYGKKICNTKNNYCGGTEMPRGGPMFGKYLIVTNTLITGGLMGLGDFIQQHIEHVKFNLHKDSYDWTRNRNMLTVGLMLGPLTHSFYEMLDRVYFERTLTNVLKKVFYDTTIATPFYIVFFFVGYNLLSGLDLDTTIKELKRKFFSVFVMECCVWIPFQFINFLFVSNKFRVAFINIVALCHSVILSYMKHSP